MPPIEAPSKAALEFFDDLGTPNKVIPKPDEQEPIKEKEEKKELVIPPDDEQPKFVREPRKTKPNADESIATLRKQRDEERAKNEKFTSIFGDHSPETIKPILDLLIERADGPITPEFVNEVLEDYRISKNKIEDLGKELTEKEKKVLELDIRYSDDFKNNFERPYQEAMQSLFLEFAQVDGEKVIGPKATASFNEFLTKTEDLDGLKIKQALNKFAREYKEETGESPILPSITDLTKAVRNFNSKREELHDAYTNWKVKKKEVEEKRLAESETQTEQQKKALRRQRVEYASKAYREFDLDSLPFVDEKDIEVMFREEFELGENVREGKDVPEYDKLIQRGVKSRLWDKYAQELADLRQFKEKVEKGERSGLSGTDRIGAQKNNGNKQYSQDHYLD